MTAKTSCIAWIASLLVACGVCHNEVKREIPSPDGAHRVVIFSRDWGATTAESCQASLLATKDALPDAPGNLFVIDHAEAKSPGRTLARCE